MPELGREVFTDELLGPLNTVETKFAPKKLFTAGDTDILQHGFRVSIVGSRNASADALRRAQKLAKLVVKRGGAVVSGLAVGIDTAAHMSAIENGGKTIAVIGTPLDKAYPDENRELQLEIMRAHLCVSQFPIGYPVQRKNFPMRNRVMALIADATVIIEASEKSGSISQGWEALRLGRPLFIPKKVLENASLKWPNELFKHGARLLADSAIEDLFECLPARTPSFVLDATAF